MLMCSMSLPLRCPFLCERDSVISVCQMWHVLSFLLHLFNDPDIAMEHTCCTVGHSLSSHGPSPALLLNHCACEALCRKDGTTCLQTVGVWSLSLEQGGDEDAIHFCSLQRSLLGLQWSLKPYVCVLQCHRREGGAEDLCTSLLLNCLRCKREKKTDLTLHCTKMCQIFKLFLQRGNC